MLAANKPGRASQDMHVYRSLHSQTGKAAIGTGSEMVSAVQHCQLRRGGSACFRAVPQGMLAGRGWHRCDTAAPPPGCLRSRRCTGPQQWAPAALPATGPPFAGRSRSPLLRRGLSACRVRPAERRRMEISGCIAVWQGAKGAFRLRGCLQQRRTALEQPTCNPSHLNAANSVANHMDSICVGAGFCVESWHTLPVSGLPAASAPFIGALSGVTSKPAATVSRRRTTWEPELSVTSSYSLADSTPDISCSICRNSTLSTC